MRVGARGSLGPEGPQRPCKAEGETIRARDRDREIEVEIEIEIEI